MYNKEMLEMWRSFKWLWVPLVFILLGIMQPVTTYYLPQILEMAGWYYTELLIDHVNVSHFVSGVFVYGLWIIFVITVLVLMSTLLRGNSAVAFVTILVAIILSVLTGLFERWMLWSPARLTHHSSSLFLNGAAGDGFLLSVGVTVVGMIAILMVAISALKRQELGD